MKYKKMWDQLKDELIRMKEYGDDLVSKYVHSKNGGLKARNAEATQRVVETIQSRMLGIEIENTDAEAAIEEG
jgi:hypothetical protein